MRKIIFPKGLLSIGANAFSNCGSLKCINLPDGLESIGENAFGGVDPCYVSFGKIRLDAAVIGLNDQTILIDRSTGQTFDERIFQRMEGLSYFALPDGVTSIGEWAFSDCEGLTRISVSPGNGAFDSRNDCNAIIESRTNKLIAGCKNTVIPDSVTSIGKKAFSRCFGLTEIHIPDSVTSIGESAFRCSGLTEIHIPESVTSIGKEAFYLCSGLTRISIPKGLDISNAGLDNDVEIIER